MNILISGSSSWPIWKFRKIFVKTLEDKNNKLFFLLNDDLYLHKIKLNKIRFNKKKKFLAYLSLISYIKKNEVKIVLEYDLTNLIQHKIAKIFYRYNYRLILIWAGLGSLYNNKGYFNLIEKMALRFFLKSCSDVILINKYDLEIVKNYLLHDKLRLIETEGFENKHTNRNKIKISNKSNYKFVSAFRPIKAKGIFEIANAAKFFQNYTFYVYIVPNNKNIKYNSKNINLSEFKKIKNLIFLDQVENLEDKLEKYDCLISASYGEGFGLSIAEATLCGLPVISTNVNGPRSIFRDESLIYVEAKSNQSLIKGIEKFKNLKADQKKIMVENAKKDLSKINNKKIFNKINKVMNEIS